MFCQSIGNTVYSGIRIYWERNQKTPTQNNLQTSILPNTNFSKPSPIDSPQPKHSSTVPLSIYALASLTYILAFYCSNLALLYVNYPTQVFGKSCKCVPVLVMGILFLKKKYPFTRYVSVFLVSFGISLFMLEKMVSFFLAFSHNFLLISNNLKQFRMENLKSTVQGTLNSTSLVFSSFVYL